MVIDPFKLERYFAKYEFNARYLLSSSDCDGFSMDYILKYASNKELNLWNELTLGYTESTGHPLLREAIAQHYKTISPEEVFVLTPGEAAFTLMQTVLRRGDEVVCMRPAYQSLYQVAESMGCRLVYWEPTQKMTFDVDDLAKLVSEKTKLVIVNFPHNPTGFYPDSDELNRFIQIVSRYNTLVFSDEMYHKLVHDPQKQNESIVDLYPNTISLWGTAKSFGLAGLRIGWVVTHNSQLLKKMHKFRDYLSICNSAPSEILTIIALNNSKRFIDVNLIKINNNKRIFTDFVNRHQSIFPDYRETTAGSTAFVRMNTEIPTLEYAENLVKNKGIMLVPSEMFDFGSSHFRIGFGRKNMPEALALWESTFKAEF